VSAQWFERFAIQPNDGTHCISDDEGETEEDEGRGVQDLIE
jgi:hypothetical protein